MKESRKVNYEQLIEKQINKFIILHRIRYASPWGLKGINYKNKLHLWAGT